MQKQEIGGETTLQNQGELSSDVARELTSMWSRGFSAVGLSRSFSFSGSGTVSSCISHLVLVSFLGSPT